MDVQSRRCKKCGHIVEESDKCPLCGEEVNKSVNEDCNAEPDFNLND